MNILPIIGNIRIQDLIDILLISVVVYHLFIWFRDTKAFKVLVGLIVLGFIFTIARTWGLFLTTWMFQILWQVLIILLIILFQPEIRQLLERVNPIQRFGWRQAAKPVAWIQTFSESCFQLAQRDIGALFILERNELVDEWTTAGVPLEGPPTPEIIRSIFQKTSPLHDGAVVIRKGRIVSAAC
jgi:DNA integrity scanning protein DisA with diadenylate cyclase activity